MNQPQGIRLNKYLASAGVGSRRACDTMVQQGEVVINGETCLSPGYRVQPEDFIKVNGRRIEPLEIQSIVLHKPAGLVCTRSDENNRATIYELLPPRLHHLAHVGRLDLDSEGLLILSNDGELTQALTHPSHKIEKLYQVTTENAFENSILNQLEKGVFTEVGKARAVSVKRISSRRLEMVLNTGLKRQIRYMIQAVGHRVKRLVRLKIGELTLDTLKPGKWRVLGKSEREALMALSEKKRGSRK
ncbi:rRNA pseudouridine synthase [Akkermansiaceae bacterium]|mgnify:FL=1|jgi:23S rRNA pseudouridine2605 synthase|nr:rRNA pseudouridine synthase [Verrucomicrobiota bacterium]MDA7516703.1 rRNA pseudouridine synthase [Akkermansiaceae bacterium]MDB4658656.1 rRNA pseudouridine synthase [bacterium]MBT6168540.1 rRNA pseudouridine synthase [Verrucomicrobiota bacterium]MBT7215733.1 rRNA pseudouridine synthase [Verrucomicrobiota bacterium]